jgi:hypothetical protein
MQMPISALQELKMQHSKDPTNIPRFALITLLMIAIAVAIGCGGSNPGDNVFAGSTGLIMNYHQDSPPAEAYSGKPFMIIVDVTNSGAYDIEEGTIYISNLVEDDVSIIGDRSKPINLYGRSKYAAEGERTSIVWNAQAKNINEEVTSTIGVTAEYLYKSHSTTSVCIDPDILGLKKGRKACTMQKDISLGDQGAPVAISAVKLDVITDGSNAGEVYFIFSIQNVGGGEVSSGTLNTVSATASLSGKPLVCESRTITLEEGVGELSCKANYSVPSEYTAVLDVELNYNYKQTLPAQEIIIKKANV